MTKSPKALAFTLACILMLSTLPVSYAGFWDDLKDKANQAKQKAQDSIDKAKQDAQRQYDQAKQKAQDAADRAKQDAQRQYDQAKNRVQDSASKAKQDAQRQYDQAKDRAQDWAGKAKQDAQRRLNGAEVRSAELRGKATAAKEELWKEIPDGAKDILVEKTQREVLIIVPYKDGTSGAQGVKPTVAKISPLEGKITAYEPSEKRVVTILTDAAVKEVTGGAVRVDDVQDLSLSKVGNSEYSVKVKAKGRALWIIPVGVDAEAVVNVETGEVKKSIHPWWSFLVLG